MSTNPDDRRRGDASQPSERREVRSSDPSLSPEANRILTEELRVVTGSDTVEVPRDRPHATQGRHGGHSRLLVAIDTNRIALGMTLLGAIVVGAVISLVTGSWWFLLLAFGLDVIATLLLVLLILQLTTETEHLSPEAAARLEDEGVLDPDATFGQLVDEFKQVERRRDVTPTPPGRSRAVGP